MKLLIADDHPLIRRSLVQLLAGEPDLLVAGEAGDGDTAMSLARSIDWDVAMLDLSMPGSRALDVLDHLHVEFPLRPVLVLSEHAEQTHVVRVLQLGAAGYVDLDTAPQELAKAIRKVALGGLYLSPVVAQALAGRAAEPAGQMPPHELLSDREYRVMWLLTSGRSIAEIATELGLRPRTVSRHRRRVLVRLGLRDDAELMRYALTHELVG